MTSKPAKIIITINYCIGMVFVTALSVLVFIGQGKVPAPDAMIPYTVYEAASVILAVGSFPMTVVSILMLKTHEIKKTAHKVRNSLLIFIPDMICGAAMLFWVGVWIVGMVNMIGNA